MDRTALGLFMVILGAAFCLSSFAFGFWVGIIGLLLFVSGIIVMGTRKD